MLFMPANNDRAVAKARTLTVDTIIIDLEDSVLADQQRKEAARKALLAQLRQGGFGYREVLARVNAPDTVWFDEDLSEISGSAVDGIVIPKIESAEQVHSVERAMGSAEKSLWIMLETPKGILNAEAICSASSLLQGVLIGTADLAKAMKLPNCTVRTGLQYALGHVLLAARANNLSVIDGVYVDIADQQGLEEECKQGAALGFDGKSLIHPAQLEVANRIFAPDAQSVSHARALLAAWESSREKERGVFVFENKMIEHLHIEQAQTVLALAERIGQRSQLQEN